MSEATNAEITSHEMSDVEAEMALGSEDKTDKAAEAYEEKIAAPVVGAPDWARLPVGLHVAPGKKVAWMLFRAEWTQTPEKGDRVVALWSLTEREERAAYARSTGDAAKAMNELAKSTIRVIDGQRADWTQTPGPANVHAFWAEIGTPCRQMIQNYYLKTHTLTREQQADFFANCFVVTIAEAVSAP